MMLNLQKNENIMLKIVYFESLYVKITKLRNRMLILVISQKIQIKIEDSKD